MSILTRFYFTFKNYYFVSRQGFYLSQYPTLFTSTHVVVPATKVTLSIKYMIPYTPCRTSYLRRKQHLLRFLCERKQVDIIYLTHNKQIMVETLISVAPVTQAGTCYGKVPRVPVHNPEPGDHHHDQPVTHHKYHHLLHVCGHHPS